MRSNGSSIPSAVGTVYLLQPQDSLKSLSREQQSVQLGYKKIAATEHLDLELFMKVSLMFN